MSERSEHGQASAEYVGLIALLALLATALLTLAPSGLLRGLAISVCDATGFCDGAPGTVAAPTPAESYESTLALPLDEFLSLAASQQRDERLDWSADGCSRVPDEAPPFSFRDACVRHDFAYRNAGLTGATEAGREAADERFREDMRASCEDENPLDRLDCRLLADVYWRGVRELGGSSYGD